MLSTKAHARALDEALLSEAWRNERVINHFRAAICVGVGVAELIHRSGTGHDHVTILPPLFMAWGITIGIVNLTWLRKQFRTWIPSAITTGDTAVLTVSMYAVYTHALQNGEPAYQEEIERAMFGFLIILAPNMLRFTSLRSDGVVT